MGNACQKLHGKMGTVGNATPVVPAETNGDLKKSNPGTGALHTEAVINEIRAATPMPQQTQEDSDENYQTIRLILLGAAESGKTTILEQVKIMHKQTFSAAELFHRKAFIYNNIMLSIRTIITRTRQLGLKYEKSENEVYADLILSQEDQQFGHFTPEIEKAIVSVWKDPTTKHVYSKRSEINLNDSTKYFLDSCESINRVDFRPTPRDLIMSYVPTVGVQNIIFTSNNRSFQLFDIGGQRIDRRKWATMYDGIDAIFFCLAISEYDQVMEEDNETNRLSDSLSLLEKICGEPKFAQTPIFLFLNEVDVFTEKLNVFPLKNYLPEYNGSSTREALDFIEDVAKSRMTAHEKNYVFRTVATDTEKMTKTLEKVFKILLKK